MIITDFRSEWEGKRVNRLRASNKAVAGNSR